MSPETWIDPVFFFIVLGRLSGILDKKGKLVNDASINRLAQIALSYAKAGKMYKYCIPSSHLLKTTDQLNPTVSN